MRLLFQDAVFLLFSSVNAGFDEHDIPLDVIWLDIEHTDGKRSFLLIAFSCVLNKQNCTVILAVLMLFCNFIVGSILFLFCKRVIPHQIDRLLNKIGRHCLRF